jgi:hypothetical protein
LLVAFSAPQDSFPKRYFLRFIGWSRDRKPSNDEVNNLHLLATLITMMAGPFIVFDDGAALSIEEL